VQASLMVSCKPLTGLDRIVAAGVSLMPFHVRSVCSWRHPAHPGPHPGHDTSSATGASSSNSLAANAKAGPIATKQATGRREPTCECWP